MDQTAHIVRMRPPLAGRLPAAGPTIAGLGLLLVGSVALGASLPRIVDSAWSNPAVVLLPLGAVGGLLVLRAGPVACITAIAALYASGIRVSLGQFAGADVMLVDLFYAGLVSWWAAGALARMAQPPRRTPRTENFGQVAAVAFILYAGITLVIADGGQSSESVISWLRLVQTASLAWLVAVSIRTPKHLAAVLAGAFVGALVALGSTLVELADKGNPGERFGGLLGSNAIGLLSGVLIVVAVFAFHPGRGMAYRVPLAVVGMLGLLMGKSVAGMVATGLALAVGMAFRRSGNPVQRIGGLLVAVAVAVFIVGGMVQILRPSATPGSADFRDSSTVQRAILGAAAVEIFERDPITGAGWRQSNDPAVIGSREVSFELHKRFQGARLEFFPDVTPGSVHNTYLQVLAETGLIGVILFGAMLALLARGARRLLRRVGRTDPLWPVAWAISLSLLLAFVWLNDNPLYGGQFDTALVAVLAGGLVAISRMRPRDTRP